LLVPGFIILSSGLQELAQKITGIQPSAVSQTLSDLFRSYPWFLTFLAVALGPGVVEELWCRGFLGRGLTARYGTIGGVLVTSTLFGLIHLDLSLLIPITLMGVFLHFVYLTSRSLGISILLHTMNNGISVFATLAGVASVFEADSHEHCLGIYLMSFALVCSGSIALWTSRPRLLLHQSLTVETPLTTPELPGSAHHQLTTASAPLAFHTANSGALIFTVVSFAVLMFLLLV
jgi:membrane protease YdiL (CAAX protease family)